MAKGQVVFGKCKRRQGHTQGHVSSTIDSQLITAIVSTNYSRDKLSLIRGTDAKGTRDRDKPPSLEGAYLSSPPSRFKDRKGEVVT